MLAPDDTWLRRVPADWQVRKFYQTFRLKSGAGITSIEMEQDADFPVYGGNGVRGYTSTYTHDGRYVLIGRQGALCGNVHLVSGKFWASEHALVVYPTEPLDRRWLFYVLSSMDLGQYSVATAQPGLSVDNLSILKLPFPALPRQEAIARYLDARTSELDDLIAKKRDLLKLLAEKRAALITRAVTKGLDPTAPMKPSGIDWLGDIPAHWDCSYRLKYLTTASGGVTPSTGNADYWRGDIPWVSPKDMKSFNISDSEDKVTELALAETSLRMIKPGAVLFVVRGMILVHTFPIGINSVPVTVNQDMKALRCDKRLDAFFLAYFLRGIDRHILSLVDTSAHGTKALRSESWKELNVPLPSPEEQRRMVSHIEAGLADIDASASLVTSAIERLTEYRAAIITKAVTGEIEVT